MIVYLASPEPNTREVHQMRWMPIREFPGGPYQVSCSGLVRNSLTGKILKTYRNNKGYVCIKIFSGGLRKNFLVHRLVATEFIPNPLGLPEVNHKDGNKENLSHGNLEWTTRINNVRHAVQSGLAPDCERHGMAKLTPGEVVSMREERAAGASLDSLAKKYRVTFGRVGAIVRGESWKRCGGPITKVGLGNSGGNR